MSRQSAWQIPQPANDRELMEAWQQAFAYTGGYHPAYGTHDLLSYSPYMQGPQLPVYDTSGSASLPVAGWEWPVQNIPLVYPEIAPGASLPQLEPSPEAEIISEEPLTEIQELKQVVLALEHRTEEMEECFGSLQNE